MVLLFSEIFLYYSYIKPKYPTGTPANSYLCNRCNKPGHYIHNCPIKAVSIHQGKFQFPLLQPLLNRFFLFFKLSVWLFLYGKSIENMLLQQEMISLNYINFFLIQTKCHPAWDILVILKMNLLVSPLFESFLH